MAKRNRLKVGRLVASTNNLRNIMGKRLEVQVLYRDSGFSNKIVAQNVIGIRQFAY